MDSRTTQNNPAQEHAATSARPTPGTGPSSFASPSHSPTTTLPPVEYSKSDSTTHRQISSNPGVLSGPPRRQDSGIDMEDPKKRSRVPTFDADGNVPPIKLAKNSSRRENAHAASEPTWVPEVTVSSPEKGVLDDDFVHIKKDDAEDAAYGRVVSINSEVPSVRDVSGTSSLNTDQYERMTKGTILPKAHDGQEEESATESTKLSG